MGLVWSLRYEEYGGEKWFFVVVVIGEGGCCFVFHCARSYCDIWDYSYLVEGVSGVMDPVIMCDDEYSI